MIGNPPYQLNDGSGLNGASALYDKFMQLGAEKARYQMFIVPMRWATNYSAKGIDKQWVYNELHSNKYKVLKYFSDSTDIFNGIRIRGGIMYYLRDNEYKGKCLIYTNESDNKQFRYLAPHDDLDIVILNQTDIAILDKIWTVDRFSDYVSNTNPFGIETNQQVRKGNIKLYKSFDRIDTISRDDVQRNQEYIDYYGNIILRTFGYGENTEKFEPLSTPIIKLPGEVCTGSYLLIYPTLRKEVANRVNKFIQTKFVAYLIDLRKSTHNCTKEAYKFIPMQDFETNQDIDFEVSIADIDSQLYRKYNLSDYEIAHIEQKFKD